MPSVPILAITRAVPRSIADGERTHVQRLPIDLDRACAEHAAYERALMSIGCRVLQIEEDPELPDSVFIEDTAVVLDEIAVMTRPGAPARRAEVTRVTHVLAAFRPIVAITAPATLDGGDVLRLGRVLYVGTGARTNSDGVMQLADVVQPLGYEVRAVETRGALHLKTAATEVADGVVLVNPEWVDPAVFEGVELIDVDPGERFASNAMRVGSHVIHSKAFPATGRRLARAGIVVTPVDATELAKAEGGVTCCSLLLG